MNSLFLSIDGSAGRLRRRAGGARARLGLACGVVAVTAGFAAFPLAAAPAAGNGNAAPAKTSDKEYVLTHKSSYTSPATTRSPFWPIGWVPTAKAATAEAVVVAPTVRPEDFVVTSISLDFPPLAVINKRTYGVGDKIPVAGTFVTLRQITDGAVVLDFNGKLLRSATTLAAGGRK